MSDQLDTAVRAYNVPRPQFGILLCLLSMLVFASQDGITKVLVKDLPIAQLVMVRYWVFLAFAVGYSVYQGSLRTACRSRHPYQQVIRSLIGVGEIVLFGLGLRYLGLAEMHALYAVFPLMTLALAGVFLGVHRCSSMGCRGHRLHGDAGYPSAWHRCFRACSTDPAFVCLGVRCLQRADSSDQPT